MSLRLRRCGWVSIGALALLAACRPEAESMPPDDTNTSPEAPDAQAVVWPDEEFRATQPEPGPVPEVKTPPTERFTLSNGLEVYLVREPRLPTVQLTIQWDLGRAEDPARKLGRTAICLDLLDEGTKGLDKVAFEEAQADHAVSVWSSGGTETSTVNLRALEGELGAGLDLMVEMLRDPGLRGEDLQRIKDQRKASIEQSRGTPTSVAGRVFPSLVWGAGHPYGRIAMESDVDAVSVGDCKALARKLLPGGARMFVVTRMEAAQVQAELEKRLGDWKGKAAAPRKPGPAAPRTGKIFLVDVPDAAQSMVMIGHPGPTRQAEDYVATSLMARILGGGFTSRINMKLREEKGYTYGARGYFRYQRNGSHFLASSSVDTVHTAEAVEDLLGEILAMRAGPPTQDELDREMDAALLTLPEKFSTSSKAMSTMRSLVYYGLPPDYWDRYQEEVRALDLARIEQAAVKHLQDRDFTVLVVGDAEVIQDGLVKLAKSGRIGKGGLVRLDADGRPAGSAGTRAAATGKDGAK